MGEDHEHRDDAQQLDTGIPAPPPFEFLECAGMPCLICAPFVPVLWLLSTIIFPSLGPSLSRKFYGGGCVRGVLPFPRLRVFISRKLF